MPENVSSHLHTAEMKIGFCGQCGAERTARALFCPRCGSHLPDLPAPGAPLKRLLGSTRTKVGDWITPVNAVVTFSTICVGGVLDFLSPHRQMLVPFVILLTLLWIGVLARRLAAARRAATGGWRQLLTATSLTLMAQDRRLLLGSGTVLLLIAFATYSHQAQGAGGVLASHSVKVRNWQEGLGMVDGRLKALQDGQQIGNALLQQGNGQTAALVTGQQTQTTVLRDINDTLRDGPKGRPGLNFALYSQDMAAARRLLAAGVTVTLMDLYRLALMERSLSVRLLLERPQAVERSEDDCAAVRDPVAQLYANGKVRMNEWQERILRDFCGTGIATHAR